MSVMDMNTTYSQAYLGDAVEGVSQAYLKYLANAQPLLDFVTSSVQQVVLPSVKHLLDSSCKP